MDLDHAINPVTERAIVDRSPGELREHRVNGPPGTGKTYYLSQQTPRAQQIYGQHGVLVCSLTRAAAKEIGGRVELDRQQVGTLHAHCYRGLDRPELAETPQGIKAWNGWAASAGLPRNLMIDVKGGKDVDWAQLDRQGSTEGEQLLSRVQLMRARRAPREVWPPKVQAFDAYWRTFKTESGRWDFTDLLERALEELPRAPGDPGVIFVDEAQDHSRLEFDLVRRWAVQAEQVVIVGDPDQAIFEWRGADPEGMVTGTPASEITLSRSRRVPRAIHAYAVRWIVDRIPDRKPVKYEPRFNDVNDKTSGIAEGAVERTGLRWTMPEQLVARLADDLAGTNDAGSPNTVMVLTTCSYMLDPMLKELRRQGLPFGNLYRPTHGGWNPLGRGADRLRTLLLPSPLVHGAEHRMWTWEDVYRWFEAMKAKGLVQHGGKNMVEVYAKPANRFDDTPPTVDIGKLIRLFVEDQRDEAATAIFSLDTDPVATAKWWHERLLDDKKKSARYPVRVLERNGARALVDPPRLTVGTIHSVKGGEADIVYVFPDLSRQGYVESWANIDQRAQTVRLFYVAFTRARERLVLGATSEATFAPLPDPKEITA